MKSFEDFLSDKASTKLIGVLDDDLSDAIDDWISRLDVQEVIDYAEEWHDEMVWEEFKLEDNK